VPGISPTLSLLSVPPSSLSLSRRRGVAWRAGTGDPHGGASRRPRRLPATWIHTAAIPGRPRLLPAPTTWIHTATTRIHGETAPTCGDGADPARMTSPAADPARWRPRRRIQRGAVAPVLGCEWARRWARDWARRRVPGFFFVFFETFNRGGHPNVPAAGNRLTAAGKAARRGKATIYCGL